MQICYLKNDRHVMRDQKKTFQTFSELTEALLVKSWYQAHT